MKITKRRIYGLIFFTLYLIILLLIVLAEKGDPDATITTYSDAFWYSIATITTVGYGDYYPVTFLGRMLGLIFMILSAGFFGFMISLFVSSFSKRVLPIFTLKQMRQNNWYVFHDINDSSISLASAIQENDEKALIVFLKNKESVAINTKLTSKMVFIEETMEFIFDIRKKGKTFLFFVGEDGYMNYQKAIKYKDYNAEIYCESSMYVDANPANIHLFDEYSNLARYLWANYPLKMNENNIVIVGAGKYGSEIIEQGLIVNVDNQLGKRRYHIFGNVDEFKALHTELEVCFAIDEDVEGKDSIYFYKEALNSKQEVLEKADRIILCYDKYEDNLEAYTTISRYIPFQGKIYIRDRIGMNISDKRVISFGLNSEIFDYDTIMLEKLIKRAKSMHNKYCENNPKAAISWDDLTEFTRKSNYAVADHLRTKVRILLDDDCAELNDDSLAIAREKYKETKEIKADHYRTIEHERWMRFHIINNWKYSKERCNEKRLHNTILPFDELTLEQQKMDDYGWETM